MTQHTNPQKATLEAELPEELIHALDDKAAALGISPEECCRLAVRAYLEAR